MNPQIQTSRTSRHQNCVRAKIARRLTLMRENDPQRPARERWLPHAKRDKKIRTAQQRRQPAPECREDLLRIFCRSIFPPLKSSLLARSWRQMLALCSLPALRPKLRVTWSQAFGESRLLQHLLSWASAGYTAQSTAIRHHTDHIPHHSASRARIIAGLSGFLILSQSRDGRDR